MKFNVLATVLCLMAAVVVVHPKISHNNLMELRQTRPLIFVQLECFAKSFAHVPVNFVSDILNRILNILGNVSGCQGVPSTNLLNIIGNLFRCLLGVVFTPIPAIGDLLNNISGIFKNASIPAYITNCIAEANVTVPTPTS
ncbi:hypothetical protein PPYR_09986 [Photinus pyralis]|uniref:Secreted protein n=1 Tax=Photinus pyralis TaxID=7054 RepID=A0A5N4AF14_PHOPY|nr:hypothetical protein PPYR_09986 [Photinus pyralis]